MSRVLDATERAICRARAEQGTDPAYFQALARFIEVFADGAHHAKEEGVLFKAIGDFGLLHPGGPLQCMLSEHALGRDLGGEVARAAEALAGGERAALFDVLDASARYAALARSHIRKEEVALFPLAAELLPPEAFETVLRRYAEVSQVTAAQFARAAGSLAAWFPPLAAAPLAATHPPERSA